MVKKLSSLGFLSAVLLVALAISVVLPPPSAANGYWRPTNVNDCPSGLICATMDLKNACCIHPDDLWTSNGGSCPSFRQHMHGYDEQF